MSDVESSIRAYAWNLQYAGALVADLDQEEWACSAGSGLENHPAWVLGHLISGADILAEDLGLPRDMPLAWIDLFERRGPGDPGLSGHTARFRPQEEVPADPQRPRRPELAVERPIPR